MHDVFVQLLTHRDRLQDSAAASLLWTIATNLCLNKIRSRRRRPEDSRSELLAQIAAADDAEAQGVARSLLARLFSKVPASTGTIAVLHLLDGLTLEEVAETVGNRDRKITLNEAYRFAFDETLAGTETTRHGPQHAVYDIQLVGTGDLVMTDLRETSALLDVGPTIGGRVYIRDASGNLAAELYKGVGAGPVSLALEPGRYSVVVDDGKALSRTVLKVRAGRKNELTHRDLVVVDGEATTARGEQDASHPDDYRTIPFSFGLVPPLTINDLEKQRKVINRFGLNLLLGRAHRIHGAEVSLGGNWTIEDVRGVQLSTAANFVGGNVRGWQATGGFNYVRGDMSGMQAAAGVDIVRNNLRGMQASGGFNFVGGAMHGAQATAGVNWAHTVRGAQLAPLNTARRVRGAQLGVLNVGGTIRGAQVGVLNIADEADAQIGLLGITRKGGVWADVWTSDTAAINVAVKFRARHTYSFLTVGVHPAGPGRGFMAGLGLGGTVRLPHDLALDMDIASYSVQPRFSFQSNPALLGTVRLMLRWQVARRFAVFGGPTFNGYFDLAGDRRRIGFGWVTGRVAIDDTVSARFWPGFALGIQI